MLFELVSVIRKDGSKMILSKHEAATNKHLIPSLEFRILCAYAMHVCNAIVLNIRHMHLCYAHMQYMCGMQA